MTIFSDPRAATPPRVHPSVDVRALIAQGVLRPLGQWYQVIDPTRLPESAQCQIATLRLGPGGALIQFRQRTGGDAETDDERVGKPGPAASGRRRR